MPQMLSSGPFRSVTRGILGTCVIFVMACDDVTVVTLEVSEVEISPSELSVAEGESEILTAIPRAESGQTLSGREVQWSVDHPEIARVGPEGAVEGQNEGTTVVRARVEGVEGTAAVTVLPGPFIGLSPEEVTLEATAGDSSPAESQVEVTNTQFGELSGLEIRVLDGDEADATWLQAELSGGIAPATLLLRASAAELEAGTFRATVQVTSAVAGNSPVSLPVTFDVAEPPPVLVVDPESVGLSAITGSTTQASQTLSVQNAGGGVLEPLAVDVVYAAGQPTGWLSTVFGSSAAPTSLTVRASARDLSPGEYAATVVVSSPVAENESVSVSVTFTVRSR